MAELPSSKPLGHRVAAGGRHSSRDINVAQPSVGPGQAHPSLQSQEVLGLGCGPHRAQGGGSGGPRPVLS